MIKVFQQLTRRSKRDKCGSPFWLLEVLLWVIFTPFEGLMALALVGFARSFSGAMQTQNKGFDDPVYKKNLQRLIERNRQFEEERNVRHS
jgi:hypothetical protein